MSDFNKDNPLTNENIQNYLGVFSMLIWSILMKLLYYYGCKKNNSIDENLISASDFALRI